MTPDRCRLACVMLLAILPSLPALAQGMVADYERTLYHPMLAAQQG